MICLSLSSLIFNLISNLCCVVFCMNKNYQILNVGPLSPKITTVNSAIGVGWYIMVTILSDYLAMMVCRISPISYWLNTAHDNLSVPNWQAPSRLSIGCTKMCFKRLHIFQPFWYNLGLVMPPHWCHYMVNLLNISRPSSIHLPDNMRPCCSRHALDLYQRGTRARKDYINCLFKILVWGNLAQASGLDTVLCVHMGWLQKLCKIYSLCMICSSGQGQLKAYCCVCWYDLTHHEVATVSPGAWWVSGAWSGQECGVTFTWSLAAGTSYLGSGQSQSLDKLPTRHIVNPPSVSLGRILSYQLVNLWNRKNLTFTLLSIKSLLKGCSNCKVSQATTIQSF